MCIQSIILSLLINIRSKQTVNTRIDTDCLFFNFLWADRLSLVDTGVCGIWVLRRQPPEWVFDDNRGVEPNAQLQKEDFLVFMGAEIMLVPLCRPVPAFVLYKGNWAREKVLLG